MYVFLVHHGDAVSADVDPQRPLSSAGRAHCDRLAALAAARGAKPDVIWHSGKLRARQTGEAYWRATNPLAPFSAARGLQPDDPPRWIHDEIEAETRDVMIVGHMPHMARLLAAITREAAAPFPANGIVALEKTEEGWREAWRLAP